MTQKGSNRRLYLYMAIAMLGAAQNGSSVDFKFLNWETFSYFLNIIAAACLSARAYIDKSPADVIPSGEAVTDASVVNIESKETNINTPKKSGGAAVLILLLMCALSCPGCAGSYVTDGTNHKLTWAPDPEVFINGLRILTDHK